MDSKTPRQKEVLFTTITFVFEPTSVNLSGNFFLLNDRHLFFRVKAADTMQANTHFLGIEIGGTKLQLATGDGDGNIQKKIRFPIASSGGAASIQVQLKQGLKELISDDIIAIGVGFGGPVDYRSGTICTSHQVAGWNNFNLVQWLQEQTGKPVAIENDANTAALAEALYGSGKEHHTVFYMTIGSGVGGGLISHGEIYHGAIPGEVEVGHLRLNKEGHTLEERCSGWAVNQKVKKAIAHQPAGLLAQLSRSHNGAEAVLLQPALEKKDKAGMQIMDEVADDLAFALSHVVHLFHPDLLVIGGGLSLLKEHLLQPIKEKLPRYVMPAFLPPPAVVTAALEEDVVPLGALALAKRAWQRQTKST